MCSPESPPYRRKNERRRHAKFIESNSLWNTCVVVRPLNFLPAPICHLLLFSWVSIPKQLLPEYVLKVLHPLHSEAPASAHQDFVWTGEDHTVEFRVGCMPGVEPGRYKCEAMVIEARDVKRLTFAIEVAAPGSAPTALGAGLNGEVELNTVVEEERGNVADVPYDELVFVRELGSGVQVRSKHGISSDRERRIAVGFFLHGSNAIGFSEEPFHNYNTRLL